MEHKNSKKQDSLYLAICCAILLVALIGYVGNLNAKKQEEARIITEQAGKNTTTPEIKEEEAPQKVTPVEPKPEPVVKAQEVSESPLFIMPVGGNVVGDFSAETPIFHSSVNDWRTHNGVDIFADAGDSVSASADGVVSKVYMNSLGYSVCIDHGDELFTTYANLDDTPTVNVGDSVKQGDVIGHIGNSALCDLASESHLHFEVMQNGEYKNPLDYLE